MPREAALLHPPKPLAPLLQAATVLLLRDGAQGLEVLMTRRSIQASFAPGAYVFPGGGIEPDDEKYASKPPIAGIGSARNATDFIASRSTQSPQLIAWALAAIRESFEELGIVLAKQAGGAWVSQEQVNLLDRHGNFYAQMQERCFQLAANEVVLLAHWLTDRDMPKRFEVPFLVARMPVGQTPVADEKEQFAPEWVRPQDALARHEAKQFFMIFPTIRTLQKLADYNTVDDVLHACASEKPLWTSCPRAGLLHGKEARFMEYESAYGELAMVSPYGQVAHDLTWQHDKPVQLLKHVWRLTAPNPSMMTGPGTNTYIVGTPEKGYLVIDPGPDIASHIERIMSATDGDIAAIICTHSHADHSPAAKPLQARVVEASNTVPMALTAEFAQHICPILGLASLATARDNAWFEPDIALQNNEHLAQYFRRPYDETPFEISLQVIHTPGHAANHLCIILPEDGLLFSGDHILNGSTTVIDPPDGDMTAYLDSLDTLHALCEQHDLRFILPAHGYVLSACNAAQNPGDANSDTQGGAARAIAALKAHRLKREAKIISAMQLQPQAEVQDLVPIAYNDVDSKLWPIAARSLSAHLHRIKKLKLDQS
ncbi:MBL fold metallo-hydrolase [Variovorax sp. PCZ-1]|uniref:MBL fold metallo-hydrolase n=1 Tax=Variovorax sp. PCZ-1 TaxID=2835533 RepID=UPI001BCD845E|nr:MBL fold metallo-hydrolase [Variovorax sp. PCZ-1]MBS7806240.1 MBL fold metallo-hydrolase [Variovorax sp. PCZ-1]